MKVKFCKMFVFCFLLIFNVVFIGISWSVGNEESNECTGDGHAKERCVKDDSNKEKYYLNDMLYSFYKDTKVLTPLGLSSTFPAYGFYPVNKEYKEYSCFLCDNEISCSSDEEFFKIKNMLKNKDGRAALHTKIDGGECHFVDVDNEGRIYNISKEEIEKLNELYSVFCEKSVGCTPDTVEPIFLGQTNVQLINYNRINLRRERSDDLASAPNYSNKANKSNDSLSPPSNKASEFISMLSLYVEDGKKYCLTSKENGYGKKKEDLSEKLTMYSVVDNRIKSYRECPNNKFRIELMAYAGFYFNDTCSVCYCCGGSIESLEDNGDPWVEHARLYPKCAFLRESKGEEFVNNIQKIFGSLGNDTTLKEMQEVINALHLFNLNPNYNIDNVFGELKVHRAFSSLRYILIKSGSSEQQALEKVNNLKSILFHNGCTVQSICVAVNMLQSRFPDIMLSITNITDEIKCQADLSKITCDIQMLGYNQQQITHAFNCLRRDGASEININNMLDSMLELKFSECAPCVFQRNVEVNEEKLMECITEKSESNILDYSHINHRIISYKDAPYDIKSNAVEMSRGGFFWDRNKRYSVCFSCKIGLMGRLCIENPLNEHAKISPKCVFLRTIMTANAIDVIQTEMMNSVKSNLIIKGYEESQIDEGVRYLQRHSSNAVLDEINIVAGINLYKESLKVSSKSERSTQQLTAQDKDNNFILETKIVKEKDSCHSKCNEKVSGQRRSDERQLTSSELDLSKFSLVRSSDCGIISHASRENIIDKNTQRVCDVDEPKHKKYSCQELRKSSYSFGPYNLYEKSEYMAESGFFWDYDNCHNQCFCCGWESKEDADKIVEKHAEWYPRCDFLRTILGTDIIVNIQLEIARVAKKSLIERGYSDHQVSDAIGRLQLPLLNARLDEDNILIEIDRHENEFGASHKEECSALHSVINSQGGCQDLDKYNEFLIRNESFKIWPEILSTMTRALSNAGFVYQGYSDVVRCFSCKCCLSGWKINDNPWIEHAKVSPRCAFLNKEIGQGSIANIEKFVAQGKVSSGVTSYYKENVVKSIPPRFLCYKTLLARENSYLDTQYYENDTIKKLSASGFFYDSNGVIKCFSCGGELNDDEVGSPWLAHAMSFPECTFLRTNVELEFFYMAQWKSLSRTLNNLCQKGYAWDEIIYAMDRMSLSAIDSICKEDSIGNNIIRHKDKLEASNITSADQQQLAHSNYILENKEKYFVSELRNKMQELIISDENINAMSYGGKEGSGAASEDDCKQMPGESDAIYLERVQVRLLSFGCMSNDKEVGQAIRSLLFEERNVYAIAEVISIKTVTSGGNVPNVISDDVYARLLNEGHDSQEKIEKSMRSLQGKRRSINYDNMITELLAVRDQGERPARVERNIDEITALAITQAITSENNVSNGISDGVLARLLDAGNQSQEEINKAVKHLQEKKSDLSYENMTNALFAVRAQGEWPARSNDLSDDVLARLLDAGNESQEDINKAVKYLQEKKSDLSYENMTATLLVIRDKGDNYLSDDVLARLLGTCNKSQEDINKAVKHLQEKKSDLSYENMTAALLVKATEALGDDLLACKVCLDNKIEWAFMPCGHACCCRNCFSGLKDHCPICRAPIKKKHLIYL